MNQISYAITQDDADTTSMVEETATEQEETTVEETPVVEENRSFHQVIKQKFIEGGPSFMGIVLLCLYLVWRFVSSVLFTSIVLLPIPMSYCQTLSPLYLLERLKIKKRYANTRDQWLAFSTKD